MKCSNVLRVKWNPNTKKNELVLLEEHVLKEIVDRLWLQARIKVWRVNCPVGGKVRPNESGIPDLLGYIPSKLEYYTPEGIRKLSLPLYIEVKRPGGVRRPAQESFIKEASEAGCVAFFAESWFDVIRELFKVGVKLSA